MGLSSSQARLLTLTGRMHDIEYKAQKLEAQKIMLANDTRAVYEKYLNALDSVKIQNKILEQDGSVGYIDTTYRNFIGSNAGKDRVYVLRETETGKLYVPDIVKRAYNASNKTLSGFFATMNEISANTNTSYISITSAEQLKNISNTNGNYRLDSDITISNWSGIENFGGIFDGNGHTITITNGNSGLFKSTNGATVKNIAVDAQINTNGSNVGGLIGSARNTTVENVSISGELTGSNALGGVVGTTAGSNTFKNVTTSMNVYSNRVSASNGNNANEADYYISDAGGFIGFAGGSNLSIEDCSSTGDVKSEYWYASGFVGYLATNTTIKNSYSESDVYANLSGKGDDFNLTLPNGRKITPVVATFIAGTNRDISISIQNTNALGSIYQNGDKSIPRVDDFAWTNGANVSTSNFYSTYKKSSYSVNTPNILGETVNVGNYPNLTVEEIEQYTDLFYQIENAGGAISLPDGVEDDEEWFTNIVMNGFATISQMAVNSGNEYSFYDVSVAIDTNLQEVSNELILRKAEAEYEASMKRIDLKDCKYDTDLAAIETERNAIKQEIETLKTVSKENVERTFKLFS